ncbi:MAG: CopD family protein [Flavobacteriales bacterium]|nr:CopD family protein [Flavobacteriales bacterium]
MPTESPALLPLLKLVHLLALAGWFAAAFHLARLFNAHRAALRRWEPERGLLHERFTIMERRALYGLAWPALVLLVLFGLWQLWSMPGLLKSPYMHLKLGLVAVLVVYQLFIHRVQARLQTASLTWSGPMLWLFGQGAWALLVALLATVTFRDQLGWTWGALGLLVLGVVIGYAVVKARGASPADGKKPDAAGKPETKD